MQLDGYHAQNLAKDFSEKYAPVGRVHARHHHPCSSNGFLADPLQRPPIDIFIRFPFNLDIKHIYLGPSIGHHRSTLIEISVHHQRIDERLSWLIDPSTKSTLFDIRQQSFYRIAQILNEDETTRRIELVDHDTSQTDAHNAKYRFSSNIHLANCSTVKLTIKRSWRLSSCAIKYLQIWGSLSDSIPSALKATLLQIISPDSSIATSQPRSDPPATNDIPSDFLDALTFDVMLIPMLLPSGYLIDRSTLEKCIAEDRCWCRAPRDPFTLVPFTDVTQPTVAQQLKIRIDQFLSEHQNDPKYRNHERLLDASRMTANVNFLSNKRKYRDDTEH